MSADLRLKKLRGSGGFIMATISDDQQRKGNLGGPDLFLAPIGRLDSEIISKYFCNTCEKDYPGSPRIDYENPNEEVADNLILVEKGQYTCSTCGSTLAEYREFKKPAEGSDVGNAKPLEPSMKSSFEPTSPDSLFGSQPPPMTESPPTFTETPQESPTPEFPSFDMPETTPQPTQPTVQTQSGSVNSIVGMSVYDESARRIGIAKQVGIDASQSIVLVISRDDGTQVSVSWDKIKKVGEIVLLGTLEMASQIQQNQPGKCSGCGFVNKLGSKFCEDCGTKL
jgi:sporulation protein YlmC with PRC-barrel domain